MQFRVWPEPCQGLKRSRTLQWGRSLPAWLGPSFLIQRNASRRDLGSVGLAKQRTSGSCRIRLEERRTPVGAAGSVCALCRHDVTWCSRKRRTTKAQPAHEDTAFQESGQLGVIVGHRQNPGTGRNRPPGVSKQANYLLAHVEFFRDAKPWVGGRISFRRRLRRSRVASHCKARTHYCLRTEHFLQCTGQRG